MKAWCTCAYYMLIHVCMCVCVCVQVCITHCEPRARYNAFVIVEADGRTNRWQFIPGFRRNRLIRRIRVQVSRHFELATHTHHLPLVRVIRLILSTRCRSSSSNSYRSVRFISTPWHVVYGKPIFYYINICTNSSTND